MRPSRLLLPLGLATCLGACGKPAPPAMGSTPVNFQHAAPGGTPVARFGGDAITAEELRNRFAEMSPYARARYQSVEQKTEYLEGLARFELLAQEAVRQGLQNDPDVIETAKKVMVQKLMQRTFDDQAAQVDDAALRAYYEAHKADYEKQETWRLAHVFLAAPAKDAAQRASQLQAAQALLAQAKALDPMDFAGFAKLAREHSQEPRTQPLEGDMRYLSAEELQAQYGAPVAEAAAHLHAMGELAPAVVATDTGFHVLKLEGHQNALHLSEQDVAPQLKGRVLFERRQSAYEAFVAELKKKSGYAVDAQALAAVTVDPSAPTQKPTTPVPGFLPAAQAAPPAQAASPSQSR